MSKVIRIKSFSSAGAFVGNITDATFDSFKKIINGGLGDLTFKLARKIDDFNTSNDVSIGNKLEVWVHDEDSGVAGVMIYSGYIEQQNIMADGNNEYVEIVCLGVTSKLTNDLLKDGSQTKLYTKATVGLTTTSADIAAAEIADIIEAMIDLFNENNPTFPIYYNQTGISSVETTGNTLQYTFNAVSYLEAIEKCREVAPQNWYWYIGADNILYFKDIASTADHHFVLNKHISRIKASKSADSVKNILLLFDGVSTYKQYKNDASISIYGRRVKQMTDINLTPADTTTMANLGAAFINENKDPKIRIEVEIIDNNESDKGYDIESIKPGDTCNIFGITPDESIFNENMTIKEVIWKVGSATLIIETEKEYGFDRLILDIEKKVKALDKNSGTNAPPETYT